MVSIWVRVVFLFTMFCIFGMFSCDRSETLSTDDTEKQKAIGQRVAPQVAEPTDVAPSIDTDLKPADQRLAVGEKGPGFRLRDQNGREQTLESLLEHGKVALVFFRSADW